MEGTSVLACCQMQQPQVVADNPLKWPCTSLTCMIFSNQLSDMQMCNQHRHTSGLTKVRGAFQAGDCCHVLLLAKETHPYDTST